MLNKYNICGIIEEHQKMIDEIEKEMPKISSSIIRDVLKDKLGVLKDNQYRYKLQAKRWGIKV